MSRIEESMEIPAARSDLFRFCHDIDKRPQWDGRVVRIKLLSPGSVRRGAMLSIDAGRGGEYSYTWDGEYAEYQYLSRSKLRVMDAAPSAPFKSGSETWTFSSTGVGSTRFKILWTYEPRGVINRVLDALFRRAVTRRAIRGSLANLRKMF